MFGGFIVAVPEWSLPDDANWSLYDMRQALLPYVIMIALGILVFAFTRLVTKSSSSKTESA